MFFKCWREDFGFYWGRRGQSPALAPFSAPNGGVTLKFLKTFFQNLELCMCVCVHVPTRVPRPCPFLCSQWQSHIEILENFFSKHRIVYMCVCTQKFDFAPQNDLPKKNEQILANWISIPQKYKRNLSFLI